jgi:cellulose synthase/poly-beta-1,6-N-acetylglucosamine synthase-like glycosyltransferase
MTDATERDRPIVTVVIPSFKRPELVVAAVRSVIRQDLPPDSYEVIVVDSSPDDSIEDLINGLQSEAECALTVLRKEPEGPGPSRNMGARHGRGEFVAFTDSDCEASPQWLREALAAFEDGVGFVQGRTRPDPKAHLSVLSHYVCIETESFFYQTCNIVYRRSALEEAGGFPRDAWPAADRNMGGEDTCCAWRALRKGWQVRFAEKALVYHAVIPKTPWFWLCNKSLFIMPMMVRQVPETRPYFYHRYFYDRPQAALVAALAGAALAPLTPLAWLLLLPYLLVRGSESTKTLRGPLRLLRPLLYFPRDMISLALLTAGSIRYRSLLV